MLGYETPPNSGKWKFIQQTNWLAGRFNPFEKKYARQTGFISPSIRVKIKLGSIGILIVVYYNPHITG